MKIQSQRVLIFLLVLSLNLQGILSKSMRVADFELPLAEKKDRVLQVAPLNELIQQAKETFQIFSDIGTGIKDIFPFISSFLQDEPTDAQMSLVTGIISLVSKSIFGNNIIGLVASFFIGLFQQDSEVDQNNAQALNDLREQVFQIIDVVQKLKDLVTQSLYQLDQSLSFRTIDQDIYLLKSFLFLYQQSNNSTQTIHFKQLCGNNLSMCNQAFLQVADGLKDYFRTVRESYNWSRFAVSTQYVVYSSFLLNSMIALADINLKIAKQEYNITNEQMTKEQAYRYSQLYLFKKSLASLSNYFTTLYNSTYVIKKQTINVNFNTFNDLTLIPSGMIKTIINNTTDSFSQGLITEVVNRYDKIRSVMEIDTSETFNNDQTWIVCPNNSFLTGIYLSDGGGLHNIERIRCTSFKNYYYEVCQEVRKDLLLSCPNGSFIAGVFREGGDALSSLTQLKCCSLTTFAPPEVVDAFNIASSSNIWKPDDEVDFTGGTKLPLQSIQVLTQYLNGTFNTFYKKNPLQISDTIVQSNLEQYIPGGCPQDYFLTGIQQKNQNLTDIVNLFCTRYVNVVWNQCFEKIVFQYEPYKLCSPTNTCGQYTLKCEIGSYIVGLMRNDVNINTLYGIDRVVCCTQKPAPVP